MNSIVRHWGLHWQWEALENKKSYSLSSKKGSLRLSCLQKPDSYKNLRELPNILGQKFPAGEFSVETKLSLNIMDSSDACGLVILGTDYSVLQILNSGGRLSLQKKTYSEKNKKEILEESISLTQNNIFLKIYVREGAVCSFAYSFEGKTYHIIGKEFFAVPGRWVGTKIGLFAMTGKPNSNSYVDIDFVHFGK